MTPEEHFLLLQELRVAKPGSARAKEILQSLQTYQPKVTRSGYVAVTNPVTGIRASMAPFEPGGPQEFGFESRTGLTKPGAGVNSKTDILGIRATVNQLLDEIPTARKDNIPRLGIGPNRDRSGYYYFEPIRETSEWGTNRNQRASTYKRFTRGAFNAQPTSEGWKGYGERISQDTWQPRDPKTGRVQKYVKFDPVKTDNILGRLAQQAAEKVTVGMALGKFAPPLMVLDSVVEGTTGKGLIDRTLEGTQDALTDMFIRQPNTNIAPLLPF